METPDYEINWPWLKIEGKYINLEKIESILPGFGQINFDSGFMLESNITQAEIDIIGRILMDKPAVPTYAIAHMDSTPIDLDLIHENLDIIHENQALQDWLKEEGQL